MGEAGDGGGLFVYRKRIDAKLGDATTRGPEANSDKGSSGWNCPIVQLARNCPKSEQSIEYGVAKE